MNLKAFEKINYGLYIVSSAYQGKVAGCVINTLAQATASPAKCIITINKENYTTGIIQKSGLFTAVALAQSVDMGLIGTFGFHSSADTDKFAGQAFKTDENGIPYICRQTVARYSCKVLDSMDAGTHIVFLGEVLDAEILKDEAPMSYAYYHQVKRGITPPKASSYRPEEVKGYRCQICGYVLESDTIPGDFICPICGRGKEFLEKITA